MNELTRLMSNYRSCLSYVWNTYFAATGGWDERKYFCDASVDLFRGMVLCPIGHNDITVLPSYRQERSGISIIQVGIQRASEVLFSKLGDYRDTRPLDDQTSVEQIDARYVDLFDMHPLGMREFKYVDAIVVSGSVLEVGIRLLIPFQNVVFERTEQG